MPLCAVAAALSFSGCSSTPVDPTKDWSPNKIHSEAMDERNAGNYEKAIGLYEKLEGRAAGTPLAQQAQLEKAYTQYKAGEQAQALATIERFRGVPPFQYVWSNGQTVEDINLLPIGTYIVTVTDLKGCIASETIVIQTASDTIDPVINCPSNIETNTDISSCNAIVNYTAPMVTDNCPWVNTLQITGLPSGSAFPIGQTINFIGTDTSGNSSTCSFTVTVTEQEFPVITCSSDILVYDAVSGSCDALVTFPQTVASDNCSAGPVIQTGGFSSGSSFPVGTTSNTYTVTDNSGNGSNCSFNVTLMDKIRPVIACIGDTVLVNNTGQYGAFFSYSLSYSDNCTHSLMQTSGLSSGSFFPVGTTLNTFIVTDSSGNSATCSFNVIVIDDEPPVALCQNISLIRDPNGAILVDPAMIDAGSQDNSGSISRTVVPSNV